MTVRGTCTGTWWTAIANRTTSSHIPHNLISLLGSLSSSLLRVRLLSSIATRLLTSQPCVWWCISSKEERRAAAISQTSSHSSRSSNSGSCANIEGKCQVCAETTRSIHPNSAMFNFALKSYFLVLFCTPKLLLLPVDGRQQQVLFFLILLAVHGMRQELLPVLRRRYSYYYYYWFNYSYIPCSSHPLEVTAAQSSHTA